MKQLYLLIVITLLSCREQPKDKKGAVEAPHAKNALDAAAEQIEAAAQTSENVATFREELQKLKLKNIPLVDSTSFNSFKDESDYQNINAEALKLFEVYNDWNNPESNYLAISAYRLNLSKDFYTIVVTFLQNDEVMESRLINYDLYGNFITSAIVAYDEIAERWARMKATIETDHIMRHYQYTVSEVDALILDNEFAKIEPNGIIKELGIDEQFFELVIEELGLDSSKLIPSLQAFKILPNRPNEAVVVIPEIVEGSEEEHYFTLNTHIAYVNVENKQVLFHYFESAETNGWVSDAIMLQEIVIDTAPYTITESGHAFGVKTHFVGSSRINPYVSDRLSLFIVADNLLNNVLHNFEVKKGTGEWDGDCEGEFTDEEKTLFISEEKTNGYFDILVKHKITNNKAFEDENGDCDSKDTIANKTLVLKFNGKVYKKSL